MYNIMVGEFEAGMSRKVIKVRVGDLFFFVPVNPAAAFHWQIFTHTQRSVQDKV